jgi:membrane protein YqaA with SNARE-associated domain
VVEVPVLTHLWVMALAYCGAGFVSAVVPWVNAEVLMLSAVPLARSAPALAALVVAVSAGQMAGKAVMYWVSRRSALPRSPRVQGALDRWRVRFEHRPGAALGLTFVSALVGIPPFYAVSIAAGALRVAFGRFMAVGTLGRLAHFAIVALLPDLLWRTSSNRLACVCC